MPYRGKTQYYKRSSRGDLQKANPYNVVGGKSSSKKTYHNKKRRAGTSKLSDTRINTLVEKRMVEIAEKTVHDNLKILTSRKYLFHRYNPNTNEFTVFDPQRDLIDWTGSVVELSNIPKTDIQTRLNAPQADDPDTAVIEPLDGDGANQLMLGQAINGERWGDIIYIRSLSAQIRVRSFQLTSEDMNLYGQVKVKYAFVLWRDIEENMDDAIVEPSASQLLRLNPWGYKGSLDKSLEMEFNALNSRVLCQGETILNVDENQTTERFTNIYKKFKKPIQISYDVEDQNGQKCNQKIYFVCRSTVPPTYDDIKPSLYACTKVNYYEQ